MTPLGITNNNMQIRLDLSIFMDTMKFNGTGGIQTVQRLGN